MHLHVLQCVLGNHISMYIYSVGIFGSSGVGIFGLGSDVDIKLFKCVLFELFDCGRPAPPPHHNVLAVGTTWRYWCIQQIDPSADQCDRAWSVATPVRVHLVSPIAPIVPVNRVCCTRCVPHNRARVYVVGAQGTHVRLWCFCRVTTYYNDHCGPRRLERSVLHA